MNSKYLLHWECLLRKGEGDQRRGRGRMKENESERDACEEWLQGWNR